MRRPLTAALSLLILGSVQIVTAQTPAPRPAGAAAQPPAANGEVRGKVVDAKSDTPIARASIAVRPRNQTTILAGAIAGADGSFRIQGLRPGPYT
ncbi:MAG TPA: carboxypeptidase-like regulatory domain-containing protein, partial [Gemmatimonadaceae bacterium]